MHISQPPDFGSSPFPSIIRRYRGFDFAQSQLDARELKLPTVVPGNVGTNTTILVTGAAGLLVSHFLPVLRLKSLSDECRSPSWSQRPAARRSPPHKGWLVSLEER